MRIRTTLFSLIMAAGLVAAGCDNKVASPPTSPTPPAAGTDTKTPPAGDKAQGDAAKKPEEKPAAPAGGDYIIVPGYEDVKVGQKYISHASGGTKMISEIKAKTDDEVTVVTSMEIPNVPAQPGTESKLPIRMKKTGDAAAPAKEPEKKVLGKETIEVSGHKFECEITEQNGMKMWMAKKYPFSIKTEMGGNVMSELKEIK